MRIKLLVSVIKTLYFHQSDFYLHVCSIVCITPASIYIIFFSLVQLLLIKDSVITPASMYAVLFSSLQLQFLPFSFHHSIFFLLKNMFKCRVFKCRHTVAVRPLLPCNCICSLCRSICVISFSALCIP